MSMVWPCPLTVDAYASTGRAVQVPRPECPSCSRPVVFWSGYWRHVRWLGRCRKIFIRRVRCRACRVSHALLPAFTLAWRLDAAEAAGAVIGLVASGRCGVRPAAARVGVPHTTARGWVRRFAGRAGELAVSVSAPAVGRGGGGGWGGGGGGVGGGVGGGGGVRGWAPLGPWRFACAVTGASLLAANATSPYLIIGRRRFMPPRST